MGKFILVGVISGILSGVISGLIIGAVFFSLAVVSNDGLLHSIVEDNYVEYYDLEYVSNRIDSSGQVFVKLKNSGDGIPDNISVTISQKRDGVLVDKFLGWAYGEIKPGDETEVVLGLSDYDGNPKSVLPTDSLEIELSDVFVIE
jgi:hypothetical protein